MENQFPFSSKNPRPIPLSPTKTLLLLHRRPPMALSTHRLRRSVLLASSALRRASAAPPASPRFCPGFSGAVSPPNELGRVPAPLWLVPSASFRSSPSAASSRFGDDEKISPDTILFEGCDYNHWLITMDFPKDPKPTAEEMVETYVQTCAKGLGCSIEEAKKKMYACSTTTYQGFQAVMTEEESEKFRGLPGVVFILPDSYIDPVNKEYGGDKYINGTIIPRPPPIQYSRNQGRRDRPRRDFQQMRSGNMNDLQYPPPRQNYVPPGQNDGRGFGPPGQNDGRGFGPPGQNDGRGFGPPGQNDGRGFGPPGQNDGRGFGPPGQNDGRRFAPPGQNDGRGYAQSGPNDTRGYTQPGQDDGRGYGPPGQYEGRGYGQSGPISPPGYRGDWRGPPPPQGPPVYNQGDRGNFNPQGPPAVSGDNRGMNSPPVGDYREGGLGYNQNFAAPGQGQRFDGDYRRDGPPGYGQNYEGPNEPPRYTPNDGMRNEQ